MFQLKRSAVLFILCFMNTFSIVNIQSIDYQKIERAVDQSPELMKSVENNFLQYLFDKYFLKASLEEDDSTLNVSFDLCVDFIIFKMSAAQLVKPKPHEQWWEQCLGSQVSMLTFSQWLGDINVQSRVAVREHVKNKKYKSILDIPSGLCLDFFGFKHNDVDIDYYGIDITPKLVDYAQAQGINVHCGSIEEISMQDASVDVCYARHILEHLDYYQKAISELIRVATKEVIIIFFIKPGEKPDKIHCNDCDGYLLYHNYYNQQQLEQYVQTFSQVDRFEWKEVSSNETILHIYLTAT